MRTLRASSYSNQVDLGDGNTLLFNGSTLCMDLVPTEYAAALCQGADLSSLSAEEQEHLRKRGHLTDLTRTDELASFRKTVGNISEKVIRTNEKHPEANVGFILTYSCNLSCKYCYQSTLPSVVKRHSMTEELVDTFFADGFSQLFPSKPKECTFSLFGGEPLLPSNRAAITRILAHASKFRSARIDVTTNATTLPAMLDLIGPEKGKIHNVQVTLDGDASLHDQTRIPISGQPTFSTMIQAINRLLEVNASVGIRVHLHPKKLASAEILVKRLEADGLLTHPNVFVYFAPINDFTAEQVSSEDLAVFRHMFQDVAAKASRPPSNFLFMSAFLKMQKKKVLPITSFCGLGSERFYVVDPLRDIYQCYEEAGHKQRRVGTFAGGKVKFFALRKKYAKRQLGNLPECLRCSAALFCGGGCPALARHAKGSIFQAYCHQNKEFIGQTLKAFFLRKAVEAGAH